MNKKVQRMVDRGALDADRAARLDPETVEKVEKRSDEEIQVIIDFHLDVSPHDPWEPDEDGSVW